jgi:hypothetical protein
VIIFRLEKTLKHLLILIFYHGKEVKQAHPTCRTHLLSNAPQSTNTVHYDAAVAEHTIM